MSGRRELRTLSRATLVSIGATGVELALVPLLTRVIPDWATFALVQLVANAITFLAYRYWAFEGHHSTIGTQYAKQSVVFGGSWVFNTAIPSLLTRRAHLGPTLAFALSNVVVYLAWNYPLNRFWVFHRGADAIVSADGRREEARPEQDRGR